MVALPWGKAQQVDPLVRPMRSISSLMLAANWRKRQPSSTASMLLSSGVMYTVRFMQNPCICHGGSLRLGSHTIFEPKSLGRFNGHRFCDSAGKRSSDLYSSRVFITEPTRCRLLGTLTSWSNAVMPAKRRDLKPMTKRTQLSSSVTWGCLYRAKSWYLRVCVSVNGFKAIQAKQKCSSSTLMFTASGAHCNWCVVENIRPILAQKHSCQVRILDDTRGTTVQLHAILVQMFILLNTFWNPHMKRANHFYKAFWKFLLHLRVLHGTGHSMTHSILHNLYPPRIHQATWTTWILPLTNLPRFHPGRSRWSSS